MGATKESTAKRRREKDHCGRLVLAKEPPPTPEKVTEVLTAYSMTSCVKAGKQVHLGATKVLQIARDHPEEFGQIKQAQARRVFGQTSRLLDSFERTSDEEIDKVPLTSRGVFFGILTDKAIALTAKDPPTLFDYEGLAKVIRLHDALAAHRSQMAVNVTPTEESNHANEVHEEKEVRPDAVETQGGDVPVRHKAGEGTPQVS